MKKTIIIDVEEMLNRLDSWLDKVEDCYREEVKQSMDNFKKDCKIK